MARNARKAPAKDAPKVEDAYSTLTLIWSEFQETLEEIRSDLEKLNKSTETYED